MFSGILWRGLLRRFAVVSDGTCGPGSTLVQGDSWPSCICRPTWYFPVIPAEIHTTRKRAFFCSSWTPMVSPMFKSTSIPETKAPLRLMFWVRAFFTNGLPWAVIPNTRTGRLLSNRGSGR